VGVGAPGVSPAVGAGGVAGLRPHEKPHRVLLGLELSAATCANCGN